MTRTPRPLVIAGNWKMHTTPADAATLAREIADATDIDGVTRVICPPFVSLAAVGSAVAGSGVHVGAQDVHAENMGAYTGEVSAAMLVGLASWCIVGHSERRRDQCEDDELVARKLLRCVEYGLRPILCVGEQLAERESGRAEATVRAQLEATVAELRRHHADAPANLVVAYEPIWAIGTGRTARGADAAAMAGVIRSVLDESGLGDDAAGLPVLYGGSVTSATIDEFLAEPSIDGALVGGASLKVDEMAAICARAGIVAAARRGAADQASTEGSQAG